MVIIRYQIDSDGDGIGNADEIAAGTSPNDATSVPMPDMSDADAVIGADSGLDHIESDVALWVDASNINARNNIDINGDAILEWTDLSGNGMTPIQLNGSVAPHLGDNRLTFTGGEHLVLPGLTLGDDFEAFIVMDASEAKQTILARGNDEPLMVDAPPSWG